MDKQLLATIKKELAELQKESARLNKRVDSLSFLINELDLQPPDQIEGAVDIDWMVDI